MKPYLFNAYCFEYDRCIFKRRYYFRNSNIITPEMPAGEVFLFSASSPKEFKEKFCSRCKNTSCLMNPLYNGDIYQSKVDEDNIEWLDPLSSKDIDRYNEYVEENSYD